MAGDLNLTDPISAIKGIGPALTEKLERLEIKTVDDLIYHFPFRYLDYSTPSKIKDIKDGNTVCFVGKLQNVKSFYTKSGKLLTEATAEDETGKIKLYWFSNPYIKRLIKEGTTYTIAGKSSLWSNKVSFIAPSLEEGDSFSLNTRGFVPVYHQTEGVNSRWLRNKIFGVLNQIQINDPLDHEIIQNEDLVDQKTALHSIHFPRISRDRWIADKRLSFNQHLQINLQNQSEIARLGPSIKIKILQKIHDQTLKKLPFELTPDQTKTVQALYKDLVKNEYTHRLIQGDTGSGKTATLIFCANQALANGYSCAIMAPTEILATQHFNTFQKYALEKKQVQLVTAQSKNPDLSQPTILVGTHSLINQIPETVKPPLLFVAIDEQHKFGVSQREALINRRPVPHIFNLSATPIPRTVALGLLGDIEISNINTAPTNRLPTKTHVISPDRFQKSTQWLEDQLKSGNQLFAVCPNIFENVSGVSSVEKIAKDYVRKFSAQFPVFIVHGKMKTEDQHRVVDQFSHTPSSILVSTSLIEVGIDIPSANIMIIHSAERFGLAQLHQLRGRVGRGGGQGYCFLLRTMDDEEETERLSLLQEHHSGLILAQKDLKIRGAGEVFGIKQHGNLDTRLKYFWSKPLFLRAKRLAKSLLKSDPAKAQLLLKRLTAKI